MFTLKKLNQEHFMDGYYTKVYKVAEDIQEDAPSNVEVNTADTFMQRNKNSLALAGAGAGGTLGALLAKKLTDNSTNISKPLAYTAGIGGGALIGNLAVELAIRAHLKKDKKRLVRQMRDEKFWNKYRDYIERNQENEI